MATNVVIAGLSGRGFRVRNSAGNLVTVKEGTWATVDLENESVRKVLSRERDNFVRVANTSDATPLLRGLSRRGFRVRNQAGSLTSVVQGASTEVDLAKGDTRRTLRRARRDFIYPGASDSDTVTIFGLLDAKASFNTRGTAVAASLQAVAGANGLIITADSTGPDGNDITVAFVEAGTNTPLSVDVTGTDIVVNLETDGNDSAVSTSAEVEAAINGDAAAAALVTADAQGDGSTVAAAFAEAPLTGGANEVNSLAEGATVEVDLTNPRNLSQLRRHFRAWVEA